jgi:hypothetical protein
MPKNADTAERLAKIAEIAIKGASKTVTRIADEAIKAECGPEFLRAIESYGHTPGLECLLGRVRMNRLQRGV